MSDISAPAAVKSGFLRKKVAGIPVLYLLLAGVLVLAVIAYRARTSVTPDAPVEDAPDAYGSDGAADSSLTDGGAVPAFTANPVPTYDTSTDTNGDTGNASIQDNSTWLKKSVEWQVSKGESAGTIQVALQKYLNGEQLSYEQGAIRDACVREFGFPPDGFDAGTTLGKPGVKKNGVPPTTHTVQGTTDNTFATISNLYYGAANSGDTVENIAAANTKLPNGALPVGTKVVVPAFRSAKTYTTTKKTNTAGEVAKKNGISTQQLVAMNPGVKSPYAVGTRLRVG